MKHQLTILPLGQTVPIEEGQSILDAGLRAGIYLPHACCHGLCATCKVDVVEGEVDHGEASTFALMDFEREEGKTLACCATTKGDVTIEADIDEDPDAENFPVGDFIATVRRIEALTPTIRGIWLEPEGPAPRFQAGQYINLKTPVDPAPRAFSLASPPDEGLLELNVRIVPGGKVTTYLHTELREGDRLEFAGPYGRFFVRKSARLPLLFLAGGSGLSSPVSMILDLLAEGYDLPITLVNGARNRTELYYDERLADLAHRYENFTYLPVLSDESLDSSWNGLRGYVHEAAAAHFQNDFRGYKAYLCGPPVMLDACITMLMRGRLFERDIYVERFFSAADAQQVRSPLFKRT